MKSIRAIRARIVFRPSLYSRKPIGAEQQLRTGSSEQYILQRILAPAFHSSMQGVLAFVLYDQKRIDEAREAAKPVCRDASAPLRERLTAAGLCTAAR